MSQRFQLEDAEILKYGGGVNSHASEDDINPVECHLGENFGLDLNNRQLRPRLPFDLVGTAPNAGRINGFATLRKTDASVSLLVQAGDKVYEWTGSSFVEKATVNSAARLRGYMQAHWPTDDLVLIGDLALEETVKEWNGTAFADVAFTDEQDPPQPFGAFKAKYVTVDEERAIFANVIDPGAAQSQLVVGSALGDYKQITVTKRPSSASAEGDPWTLPSPDLRPINNILAAFGSLNFSTEVGNWWFLTGSSAKDFAVDNLLFPNSGADGMEPAAFIGNDIVYGRQGRIESLVSATQRGDILQNDLSNPIAADIETFTDWTIVYNARTQLMYCIPAGQSQIWAYHKPLRESELSPWIKFTTQHASAFNPTAIMSVFDPADGLEHVFFGDDSGNVYRLEGSGRGDAGTTNIKTVFRHGLTRAPLDAEAYNIDGYIKYRKNEPFTITLNFLYSGQKVFDESISVNISGSSGALYNGAAYYGGTVYYGANLAGRLNRIPISPAGSASEFQVETVVDGTSFFQINEIGLRFEAAD